MSIVVEAAMTGGTYMWGAPTFDQVSIAFDETERAAYAIANFNKSRMMAKFPRGGRIVYRSLDNPNNARGWGADGVVMDEVSYIKQEAWYEVLRPMLIDTGGWSWGIGTSNGHNWFYDEHTKAAGRDDSMSWQAPTLGVRIEGNKLVREPHPLENPDIPFSEIEMLFHDYSEKRFKQEILADFVDMVGEVFRRVRDCATATPQDTAIEGHDYIISADWALSNDYTVLTVFDLNERAIVYIDRFNQVDYTIQADRLKALARRFNPIRIVAESNSMGMPIIHGLANDGLPMDAFHTSSASKDTAIRDLAIAFETGDIRIIPDETLISELMAYQVLKTSQTGMPVYGAPAGMHDDCVMSAAIGWSRLVYARLY